MSEPETKGRELFPNAKAIPVLEDYRIHDVDLERVQRVHLGLDNEPMEFSADTLARMIQDVANNCGDADAFILHGIVRALTGEDGHHRLTLQQIKRGRFIPPDAHRAAHTRRQIWLHRLAHLERQGVKTEAAVTEIAKSEGVSRATVFSEVRKEEEWLQMGREIFPDSDNFQNPRPVKGRKG